MLTTDCAAEEQTRRDSRRRSVDMIAVFLLAIAVRVGLVLASPGGFAGTNGYDPGVYFDSAVQLVHGRWPYADFVLLHPPGLTLALTPFAALAGPLPDSVAFAAASLAFCVIGALNAVLVSSVGRRLGLRRHASVRGGVLYAVWMSAAGAEISTRLEPLGTLFFLSGVWLLLDERRGGRRTLLAGAMLGLTVATKIWWIIPVCVVVLWWALVVREPRDARRLVLGVAASQVIVLGPFFAHAPAVMWRMTVLDQLQRHTSHGSPVHRLLELSSLATVASPHASLRVVLVVALVAVAALVAFRAWKRPRVRLIVVVALAQLVVIIVSPTYFGYYSGYPSATIAIVVAAASDATPAPGRWSSITTRSITALCVVSVAASAAVTVVNLGSTFPTEVRSFPAPTLTGALRGVRCVRADSPVALVELDVLSRNLRNGCADWGDVSGRTYDTDAPPPGRPVARSANAAWQRDIARYLLAGDAYIIIRGGTGLNARTRRQLRARPVVARSGRFIIYRGLGHS